MDDKLTEDSRKSYANVIQSETERLSSLTKQLLLLTSLDQLSSPLEKKTFDLDVQLKETVRKYRWLLEEKEMTLEMDIEEVRFTGDPAFLEKVWENLLSNALKYTEIGGAIEVVLTEQSDQVKVLIKIMELALMKKYLGAFLTVFIEQMIRERRKQGNRTWIIHCSTSRETAWWDN